MNIERMLQDHLWNEIHALQDKQAELQQTMTALHEREELLRRIADAAGISETIDLQKEG